MREGFRPRHHPAFALATCGAGGGSGVCLQRLGDGHRCGARVRDQKRQRRQAGQQQLDTPRDVQHVIRKPCAVSDASVATAAAAGLSMHSSARARGHEKHGSQAGAGGSRSLKPLLTSLFACVGSKSPASIPPCKHTPGGCQQQRVLRDGDVSAAAHVLYKGDARSRTQKQHKTDGGQRGVVVYHPRVAGAAGRVQRPATAAAAERPPHRRRDVQVVQLLEEHDAHQEYDARRQPQRLRYLRGWPPKSGLR